MLSRSFSPSKISRFPPPPPPPSAPPPRNKNYRSHRQRQSTKDNNAAPKDDHRPLPLPTITHQQDPTQQQMTARIEQPLEEYQMGPFDTIHIDPTVATASSSDHPNISDDSSTSGTAWKMRLRHIFHRKQQHPDIYMNHVDVEHEPTGDDEGMAVRHNPRNDHINAHAHGAGSTEPQPPFDGIVTTGLSSTDYNCNDNYHNEYIGDAQRYHRQRLFTRSKKRKAPFRSTGAVSNSMNHYIQNQELKIPFHSESGKAEPPPYQLEMSVISNSQTDQKNLHQLSENDNGSNRWVRNNDNHCVANHHHPRSSSSDDNNNRVLILAADDPVSDFDDSEWTPMDSSYGAAIPLAGWIPKRIRRTIEFTVLLGLAVLIVFLIVEKSVTSSNHNKSNNSSNNNIVNQVIDNYNGDDEVFYNYSNYENTTIYDDDVNLR